MTALPNAAAGASGGLPVLDAALLIGSDVIAWNGGLLSEGAQVTVFVADESNLATTLDDVYDEVFDADHGLEAIRDRGDAAWGSGALTGPSSVTLTWRDAGGAAVPLVDFTIIGQGSGRASAAGVKAFGLPDGTYTVVSRPTALVLFANATLVVSGTTAATITGTSAALPEPSAPDKVVAYVDDAAGAAGVRLRYRVISGPGADGYTYDRAIQTTDASGVGGRVTVELFRDCTYQFQRGEGTEWMDVSTHDRGENFALPEILGQQG
jgi:hypothetical protein